MRRKYNRKRIWYWICAPHRYWWITGINHLVRDDDPVFHLKGGSSKKFVRTIQKVDRILANCPTGTVVTRFMDIRGKHYILDEWEKI